MPRNRERWNRTSYTFLITLCAGASVFFLADLMRRILQIAPNHDVAVTVPVRTTAYVAAGPDGADVPVTVTQGVIHVSGMPPITIASLLLGEIVRTGAAIAVIVLLGVFLLRMSRGVVFDRINSGLVIASGITIIAAWMLGRLFTTMGVNGAFAALSDHRYDNGAFPIDATGLFAGGAVLLIGTAFGIGARLQRDTEGLV